MSSNLNSDKPINDRSEDVLRYWPFAMAIAAGVTRSPREGFVVGIQAAWGMGKTSAVNLILTAVKELESALDEHERTVVARFNPWMFSGVESLASGYLSQIGSVIAESLNATTLQKSAKLIKKIGKSGSDFLGGAAALGVIAATGGAAIPLASAIKSGVGGAVSLASQLGNAKELHTLASELRDKLSKLSHRIIIVLDDLDRLQPEELRQILTLVKTFGDLPNVVHLLVYDRKILCTALGHDPEDRTTPSYLEKIIQAEYDLPVPTRDGLLKLLSSRVDPLFKNIESDDNWSSVWSVAFDYYLKSPRDINRFGNALSVTWPTVAGEVYPPDLIAIELFRIFDQRIYKAIVNNKDILVGLKSIWSDKDRESLADHILDVVGDRADVLSLVRRMFPRLSKRLDSITTGSNPRGHRMGRLIGSEEGFDSFFRFEPSPLQMSVATVRALDERLADEEFVADLLGGDSSIPPSAVLDELWELLGDRQEASVGTLSGILRGAARVYEQGEGFARVMFGLDDHQRLRMIFNKLLELIPQEQLNETLPELLSNELTDISASGLLVAKLGVPFGGIYEGADSESKAVISEARFKSVARKVAARVRKLATQNDLLHRAELWVLLRIWTKFGKKGEAKSWLETQLDKPAEAASVIFSSMNITSHSGRSISRRINRLPDSDTYDVDALVRAAERHLSKDAYSGQDKEDVETFVASIAKLQRGESAEEF